MDTTTLDTTPLCGRVAPPVNALGLAAACTASLIMALLVVGLTACPESRRHRLALWISSKPDGPRWRYFLLESGVAALLVLGAWSSTAVVWSFGCLRAATELTLIFKLVIRNQTYSIASKKGGQGAGHCTRCRATTYL